MNSSVGPDAFLFDKPVIALGKAPWIKPGLAFKVENAAEICAAILRPSSFSRAWRRRFIAHWYHAYTFPADGDPTALVEFVPKKISLATAYRNARTIDEDRVLVSTWDRCTGEGLASRG